jgi:hypothetical protein
MVDPNAKLEEELFVLLVRLLFGLHIRVGCNLRISLLINQWANVVLGNENEIVLRTAEFYGKKGIPPMPKCEEVKK